MDSREATVLVYSKIVDKQVLPRLNYYKERVEARRVASRATSVIVIVISLFVIPLATNFLPESAFNLSNKFIVSTASLLIGLITGLQELFKWESVWRQYSIRIIEIESALALWQLEVAHTAELATSKQLHDRLFEVTKSLLQTVDSAVLAEMDKFFTSSKRDNDGAKAKPDHG